MLGDLGTDPIFEGSSESGGEDPPARPTAGKPAARRPDPPPEDVDAGMQSGGEEPSATQALEAGLKKRKWQGTEEVQRKWLTATNKDIDLDRVLGTSVSVWADPGP